MRLFGAAAHPPGHPPARPSTTTHPRQWPLTVAPSPVTAARCCAVKGESHMNVFIAGASSSGLLKSHALLSRRGAQGWRGVSRSLLGAAVVQKTHWMQPQSCSSVAPLPGLSKPTAGQ